MEYIVTLPAKPDEKIRFIDITNINKPLPNGLNFDEVLKNTLEENLNFDKDKIKCICTGSDEIKPYFSDFDADVECWSFIVSTYENQHNTNVKFDTGRTVYNLD